MAASTPSFYESHSSQISIKQAIPEKGKGLFANTNFKEGDIIFEEKPLVCSQFLWNAMYKYTACGFCMKSLETAEQMARRLTGNATLELPYAPKCCEIMLSGQKVVNCHRCQMTYCSEVCRQTAWNQYHRMLCLGENPGDPSHPLEQLQEAWRKMHYPPETTSVMLIAQMIATVLQASDPDKMKSTFESFCHSVVNKRQKIVHKLLGDQFKVLLPPGWDVMPFYDLPEDFVHGSHSYTRKERDSLKQSFLFWEQGNHKVKEQLDILRVLLSNAVFDDKLEQWFKPEGFQSLMALIGTNGQGIGTSTLSIYVNNLENLSDISEDEQQALDIFINQLYEEMDNVSGQFLNCEGSGLYALQSSCNHSCEPNAEVTFPFNNSTLVLKALQSIQRGEEIVICYLGECDRDRSRHTRQRLLRENYLFTCICPKCESEAGDPDVTSSEDEDDSVEEDA